METKELCNKIKYLVKKKKGFIEICNELQLKDYEVIGLIGLMKQDGELIDYINNVNQIPNIYVVKNELCENKVMACKTI